MHSLLKVPSERHRPKQLSMHLNMTPLPTSTIADPRSTDPEVTWGENGYDIDLSASKFFASPRVNFAF